MGMRPKVSKRQMYQAIQAERERAASLMGELSAEDMARPSLCDRWTVGQVAGHLVSIDEPPWGFFWARATRSVPQWMDRKIAQGTARGRDAMVAGYRRHRMPYFARFGAAARNLVFGETVIHQEDMRRPLGKPRAQPPDPEATWAYVWSASSQLRICRQPGRVKIESPGGRSAVWEVRPRARPRRVEGAAEADVTVRGEPLELAMYLSGRLGAANVEVLGQGPLAEELRGTPLRFAPFQETGG